MEDTGMQRFVRCQHCNMPHAASTLRCPITGETIAVASMLGQVDQEVQDIFDLVGSTVAERFDVAEVLGCGGMGAVYAGQDRQTNERVAIKVMRHALVSNPDAVERFLLEGKVTQRLAHPRIVKHVAAGTLPDNSPYLVLEYLEGEPLIDWLRKRSMLSPAAAVQITEQVLAGLGAAHEAGVVHRDIKPENIFVEAKRQDRESADELVSIRVLDFGISKLVDAENSVAITKQGEVIGSPYYLAPEQILAANTVRAPTDLWATGVVLYEMLTGVRPFEADTLPDLLVRIVSSPFAAASSLNPAVGVGLDGFIEGLLAKKPEERFQDVAEALAALARVDTQRSGTVVAASRRIDVLAQTRDSSD